MTSIWPTADLCTLRLNNQVAWIGLMAKASRQLTRLGREAGRRIRVRIATLWPLKFGLTLALATLIQVPHFLLQRCPLLPAHEYEPSRLDQWVAFDPKWVWGYFSVYLLAPIPPWLTTSRVDLRRYTLGIIWVCLIAWAVFLIHPVAGPRPDPLPEANLLFDLLVRIDRPTNSFPALHVAVPAYALFFGAHHLRAGQPNRLGRIALALGWLWLVLVAYSTLATKQHFAADIAAGVLLGWAVDRWITGDETARL